MSKYILPVFDVSPETLELYGTQLAPAKKGGGDQIAVDVYEPLKPIVPLRSVS